MGWNPTVHNLAELMADPCVSHEDKWQVSQFIDHLCDLHRRIDAER
jgi:hypothetical protein